MTKKVNIYQIDAFTDKPFSGNPAGVCFGDGLTSEEMQLIAKEMNLAETAFIIKSSKADYQLRWFTPAVEVNLCGHATIASLHFLSEQNKIQDDIVRFSTRSGILKCKKEGGNYYMQIPLYKTEEYYKFRDEILNSLNLSENEISSYPFVIAEHGYLYLFVKNLEILQNLKPDFKKIAALPKEIDSLTVVSLETIDQGSFAHLRFFAPAYGINEDIVTGSANGPLLLVLKRLGLLSHIEGHIVLNFEQGDFLGRPGRIRVEYSPSENELYISGKAVSVLKGEISF